MTLRSQLLPAPQIPGEYLPPLDAYEILIDKMLSLPPQRAILELVPDQGAEPRPDGL